MSQKPQAVGSTSILTGRRSFLTTSLALAPLALVGTPQILSAKDAFPKRIDKPEKDFFASVRKHENAHVAFLVAALGEAARPKPTFKGLVQKKASDFLMIAQALENTGVGAYLGPWKPVMPAPSISS
jgi:hypothetical protein